MRRLLIAESDGFSPEALSILRGCFDVTLADLNRSALIRAVGGYHALWVRLRNRIDAEVMSAADHLETIASPTTGLNHIDLEEAERLGIQVVSLQGETDFLKTVSATAELAIALILSALRHVPAAVEAARAGLWCREAFRGRELAGQTVGIIGYGRLGRMVGHRLLAFGAKVLATDPAVHEAEAGVELVAPQELLQRSGVVTLHVNLCPATERMFGAPELQAMRPGAVLINTARGELLDEDALLDSLEQGRLAAAALDVLSGEQAPDFFEHRLIRYAQSHSNLILTPHLGGCTVESMHRTECFLAERLAGLGSADFGRAGVAVSPGSHR